MISSTDGSAGRFAPPPDHGTSSANGQSSSISSSDSMEPIAIIGMGECKFYESPTVIFCFYMLIKKLAAGLVTLRQDRILTHLTICGTSCRRSKTHTVTFHRKDSTLTLGTIQSFIVQGLSLRVVAAFSRPIHATSITPFLESARRRP